MTATTPPPTPPPTSPPTSPDRSRRAGSRPPRPRRWVRRTGLGLVAALIVGLASASPLLLRALRDDAGAVPVAGVETVEVVATRFTPAAVAVPPGTTVTFAWTDGSDHDLRFDDGVTVETRAAGTWTRTFDEPGSYPYRCTLHAFMDGRVEVG